MNYFKKTVLLSILCLSFLVIYLLYSHAEDKPMVVEMGGENAEVTLVQGKADRIKKGAKAKEPLVQGDILSEGDQISTEANSKLEIKLPDGSYIRFCEKTIFALKSIGCKKDWNISIKLFLGRIWTIVSKYSGKRRFEVSTEKATAGVRGTVFGADVHEDNSASVKVYQGEVQVNRLKPEESAASSGKITDSTTTAVPYPISGPHPVAGPHPVSMEEWVYIVKSMQKIDINPDGTAKEPVPFDPNKDSDDWIQWNMKRSDLTTF